VDRSGDGKTSIRVSYGLLTTTRTCFFYTRVSNITLGATLTRAGGPIPLATRGKAIPAAPVRAEFRNCQVTDSSRRAAFYAVSDPNLQSPQVNTWNLAISARWFLLLSRIYFGTTRLTCGPARELESAASTFPVLHAEYG